MNVTKEELERLAILAEECAEVQHIAMKIIRHGYESTNPLEKDPATNRDLLEKELGDLKFAMSLMNSYGDFDRKEIAKHSRRKRVNIQRYLHFNRA